MVQTALQPRCKPQKYLTICLQYILRFNQQSPLSLSFSFSFLFLAPFKPHSLPLCIFLCARLHCDTHASTKYTYIYYTYTRTCICSCICHFLQHKHFDYVLLFCAVCPAVWPEPQPSLSTPSPILLLSLVSTER